MKNSIKRAQSQANSSFAERENFRPKVKQLKKTILTLVALLAVTTGAWATDVYLVGNGNSDGNWLNGVGWDPGAPENKMTEQNGVYSITFTNVDANSELLFKFAINGSWNENFGCTSWDANELNKTLSNIEASGNNIAFGLTEKADVTISFNLSELTYMISTKGMKVGDDASSGPEVTWDKDKKTGTFTMPGGNVTLEPAYYPQAVLTAAPSAINDVPATTDGAIVKAGTVANIGETATAQGTVMYYVSQTALDDAALQALAADQWTADVPTAENLTEGTAHVYYYVRGNDGDTDETTFSDGDILATNALTVTIAAEPTYAVTFADGVNPEPPAEPEWTASPNTGVTKGTAVTVTYTGTKKVIGVKAEKKAAAGPKEVLTYSFDDASHPSGLTAGSRVSFDYSRTSVITNSKFLNAYNNANGDPNATTVSLGDTDLSGETWTLSFEWAACGGCNSKPDHTTLKAGDATLFDLNGNSNWNTTVTIIYTGSDGSKTLPVPGCDKNIRFTAAVGDQYNTTTYWHHIVVTGSAEGVKMTITNSSTGAAVVEDVVLSETNVNPTSLIIEPSCGGGIGIDALSLTYEE